MGKTILLADDSITIQKIVNLAFAGEGIEVVTVGNGEAALRKVSELKPDLVLADIFMPGKNGYEVCESIKNNALSETPVVLLVGAFEPFDSNEATRVGADGHLTKPFEIKVLISVVHSLISEAEQKRVSAFPDEEEEQRLADADRDELAPEVAETGLQDPESESGDQAVEVEPDQIPAAPLAVSLDQPVAETQESAGAVEAETGAGSDPTQEPEQTPAEEAPATVGAAEANSIEDDPRSAQPNVVRFNARPDATAEESPDEQPVEVSLEDSDPLGLYEGDLTYEVSGDSRSMVVDIWEPKTEQDARLDSAVTLNQAAAVEVAAEPPAGTVEPGTAAPVPRQSQGSTEAELSRPHSAPQAGISAAGGSLDAVELTDEVVERVANRVVEKLSREVLEKIAWEVVPDLAEMVIKERLDSSKALDQS